MNNKAQILATTMEEGMSAAIAGLSESAASELSALVEQFEQAGYDEAAAMENAINQIGV